MTRPRHATVLSAALAAALGTLAISAPAQANGRFPTVMSVTGRDDLPATLLVGATYGLVVTTDMGATWGWVCEQAIGYMGTFDPIFVKGASGVYVATVFDGLVRSVDGGCTWDPVPGTEGAEVRGLIEHPTVPGTYYATTGGTASMIFAVLISTDDAASFTAVVPSALPQWYDGVAASPADPLRLYAASWFPMPRQGFIHRSDDGGMSWSSTELTIPDPSSVRLLGVSATDPDIVLWLVDGVTDAVYRSDDGGATALSVFEPLGPFGAFTVGTDGTMYATTLSGMLYRSTDDGLTWMENGGGTPAATALDEIGGRLYAVTNRLATCGFALMYSEDQGDSFTGFYQLPDTGGVLATCAPGTPAHTLCDPLWPAVAAELGIGTDAGMTAACTDAGNAPGTDAGVDAGGGDGGGGKHCGGCAVAAPVGRHGRAPVAAAAALAALLLATRLAPRRRSARRCAATRP